MQKRLEIDQYRLQTDWSFPHRLHVLVPFERKRKCSISWVLHWKTIQWNSVRERTRHKRTLTKRIRQTKEGQKNKPLEPKRAKKSRPVLSEVMHYFGSAKSALKAGCELKSLRRARTVPARLGRLIESARARKFGRCWHASADISKLPRTGDIWCASLRCKYGSAMARVAVQGPQDCSAMLGESQRQTTDPEQLVQQDQKDTRCLPVAY